MSWHVGQGPSRLRCDSVALPRGSRQGEVRAAALSRIWPRGGAAVQHLLLILERRKQTSTAGVDLTGLRVGAPGQ